VIFISFRPPEFCVSFRDQSFHPRVRDTRRVVIRIEIEP
jgi:hypothetical protein